MWKQSWRAATTRLHLTKFITLSVDSLTKALRSRKFHLYGSTEQWLVDKVTEELCMERLNCQISLQYNNFTLFFCYLLYFYKHFVILLYFTMSINCCFVCVFACVCVKRNILPCFVVIVNFTMFLIAFLKYIYVFLLYFCCYCLRFLFY